MKKLFIIAAAACVTFASCMKNEPDQVAELGDEIAFDSPVLAPNVKSVNEVGTEYENGQSFLVYAYSTPDEIADDATLTWAAPDYINAGVIAKVDGVWKGSPTSYYWPTSGYLHFMAVAPSTTTGITVDKSGVAIADYIVESGDVDLMYSERILNKTKEGGSVQVEFKHALASIDFKVSSSPITTYLQSITIANVKKQGDFAQGLAAAANSTTSNSDHWTEEGDATMSYVAYKADPEVNNGYQEVTSLVDLTAGDNETSLILLPQALGETSEIQIKYHQGLAPTGATVPKVHSFPLKELSWEMGTRYTYTITFGANEITFVPSSVAWSSQSPSIPSIQ